MLDDFGVGDKRLGLQVVVEGERFDEFLDGAAELPLVAPAVEACDVWDDIPKKGGDLVEAGLGLFGD